MQDQEKELFESYEVKTWTLTPRIYKIIAAAAAFHLLAVVFVAQTNLLTRRGCDSPFVSQICQVLDAVYVGSSIIGTDSAFVDKDYENNELADADITFIDATGETPPLVYPEGYFALANPEQFAAMQNTDFNFDPNNPISGIPGIPTDPAMPNGTDLMNTPQVVPTPNNDAIKGTIPDSPFSFGGANPMPKNPPIRRIRIPRSPKIKNTSPDKLPGFEGLTADNKKNPVPPTNANTDVKKPGEADKGQKPLESEAVAGVEINRKPFEDLGDALNDKIDKKEIDLSKPFSVVLDGTITNDGKLDAKKSKFIKFTGDEQMVNVAKDAIEAVGNSGFLGYLKNNGIDRVNFTMVQDDKQIYVLIVSDQKTPEKAATTASGFNTLISGIKILDQNGLKKLDDNSKTLVNNSKVSSDGKNFVLNFTIPKQNAQDLINKSLKERAEKKNNPSNSSGEETRDANAKNG